MISIVMTYYNRPQQLQLTLKSIAQHIKDKEIEIIIVDDASDPNLLAENCIQEYRDIFDIKVLTIASAEKWWMNPCIPFNKGFAMATGDTVIIQNSESIHYGNLLHYVETHLTDKNYLVFSCYATDEAEHARLGGYVNQSIHHLNAHLIDVMKNATNQANLRDNCWYNHPTLAPHGYHFCSAITKKNLDEIGGFNEAFAKGYCFDDNELVWRIQKTLKLEIVDPKYGHAIHQWHGKNPNIKGGCELWKANKQIWEQIKGGAKV